MSGEQPKQTGLEGPSIATVYHHYYTLRGEQLHPDSAYAAGETREQGGTRGEDECSSAAGSRLKSGESQLPPAARVIFDVEPSPRGNEQIYWWPRWYMVAKDEHGTVKLSGYLSNEQTYIPAFVSIQAPERPDGMWQTSSGYRLLAIYDGLPYKASFELHAEFGDGSVRSSTLVIPWVSPA